MEFGLNLFWVLLCAASLAFWRRQLGRSNRKRRMLALIAWACALVIIFPVISLTDDLHHAPVVVDDSTSRIIRRGGNGNAYSPLKFLNAPARISHPSSFTCGRFLRLGSSTALNVEPDDPIHFCLSRSPPAF